MQITSNRRRLHAWAARLVGPLLSVSLSNLWSTESRIDFQED